MQSVAPEKNHSLSWGSEQLKAHRPAGEAGCRAAGWGRRMGPQDGAAGWGCRIAASQRQPAGRLPFLQKGGESIQDSRSPL